MGLSLSPALKRVRWSSLGRSYVRFGPYVLRHKGRLILALTCMLGGMGMTLLQPWPLKIIFDDLLMPRQGGQPGGTFFLPPALTGNPTALLAVVCAAVLGIALLSGFFAYGQRILLARVAHRVMFSIRRDLFAHVQRLPLSFHDQKEAGDLFMRMTGDIQMLREILVNSIMTFLGRFLVLAGMFVVMAWISPLLTLVAVSVIPVMAAIILRFSGKLREASRRQRRKEGKVATLISQTMSTITVVQSFSGHDQEDEKLARENRSSLRAGLRATRLEEGMARSVELTVAVGICGVLILGTHLTLQQTITAGTLLVFLSYVRNFFRPLRDLSRVVARLAKASVCAERILQLLERERRIVDLPHAIPAPCFQGRIELHHVTLCYEGRQDPALQDLDLVIQPGESVLLLGESGAGKSSIARLLLRLYDPQEGRVCIDGVDIRDYSLDSFRRQIAIVLQESLLMGATIRENISYGKPDATPEEIEEAARQVFAHDFIQRLPEGYDTMVAEGGVTFSGGERQRIALARAAIKKAPLLILDEPTTGLDGKSCEAVLKGMRTLVDRATTLIISHAPDLYRDVDRVVVLERGRIVAQGSWDELGRDQQAGVAWT